MHARGSVFAAALALSAEDRAELTLLLLDSLDEDSVAAWDETIAGRIAALQAGHANLVPLDDALSRARARLRTIRR